MPAPKKGYRGIGMDGFIARWYARNTGKNMKDYQEAALKASRSLDDGSRVLELAPGPGYFAIELAKLGRYEITGLDISESFVEMAAKNASAANVTVTFRQGNAAATPFDSDSFDFIYCRAAFKNFSEPVAAIREMHRVLKLGGRAMIVDLRKDASAQAIREAVRGMGLSRFNAWLTRLTFKHLLLKRAYTTEDIQHMVSETPFRGCTIERDLIGMEVILSK